jgi:hypothetical protein
VEEGKILRLPSPLFILKEGGITPAQHALKRYPPPKKKEEKRTWISTFYHVIRFPKNRL